MNRKKLLIIPGYDLFPAYHGGAAAQLVFIDQQQYYYDITILIHPDNISETNIENFQKKYPFIKLIKVGYENSKVATKQKKWWSTTQIPVLNDYFRSSDSITATIPFRCNSLVVEKLAKLVQEEKFDIIQVEHVINMGLVQFLPENSQIIYVHHEIFFDRIKQEMKILGYHDSYINYICGEIQILEVALLNKFDTILTLTEQDRKILLQSGVEKPVYTSTCPVFESQIQYLFKNELPLNLLFMGSESHIPNKDGLEWFITRIMPYLHQAGLNNQLLVTGAWSKTFQKKYKSKYIKFTGFIDELDPILAQSILVSPIRIGSGIRMKIITAMSKGVPVVSTKFGAIGIKGIVNDRNILMEDRADKFAQKLIGILRNPLHRLLLSKNGFELIQANYTQAEAIFMRNSIYEMKVEHLAQLSI